MNVAEYMTYYTDYTKEEADGASTLLSSHNFNIELTRKGIEKEYAKLTNSSITHHRTCIRCGRGLSNPISMRRGLGPVCRTKVKRGDWGGKEPVDLGVAMSKLTDYGFILNRGKK